MAQAYTRPLARAVLTANQGQLLGGPDVGRVWVLRDIVAYNGIAALAKLYIQVVSQGVTYTLARFEIPLDETIHLDLRQSILEGDELRAFTDGDGVVISLTGYDLWAD